MKETIRAQLAWWVLFGIVFGVCFGSTSWWSTLHQLPIVPHFSWETAVPFVSWSAWIYLSIIPAMALMAWLQADNAAAQRWVCVMILQTMVATFAFAVFPMQRVFDLGHQAPQLTLIYRLADLLNFTNNQVPSLHVAFAVTLAIALGQKRHFATQLAAGAWAVAVAISTLLIWEHHILGIAAGIALGACGAPLYKRLSRPSIWEPIHADMVCLQQFGHFTRRHRRYALIFVCIYGSSILRWRRYRALRWGFVALQWIDDVLDGDRPCHDEPLVWVEKIIEDYSSAKPQSEPAKLLELTIRHLKQTITMGDPKELVFSLIEVMKRDRRRVIDKQVWSQSELLKHHRATFQKSVDLMLAAAGCQSKAAQISHLVEAFGWSSTFRDLQDDLNQGLINVPAEVWHAANHERYTLGSLTDTREFRVWANAYLKHTRIHLEEANAQLRTLDRQSQRVLGIFLRSIERMTQRLPKKQPKWFAIPNVSNPDTSKRTQSTAFAGPIQESEAICSE